MTRFVMETQEQGHGTQKIRITPNPNVRALKAQVACQ